MQLIPEIFRSTLQLINPKSEFLQDTEIDDNGFLTEKLTCFVDELQEDLNMGNDFKRCILTRAVYLIMIPTFIVSRVADFAMGVIAAAAAVLTLGKFKQINSFAYRNLKVMLAVHDVWRCFILAVNPDAPPIWKMPFI